WYAPIFVVAAMGAYLIAFHPATSAELFSPFTLISHAQTHFALIALGAAFFWGTSTAMGRLLTDKLSFITLTGARFTMGLLFLLVWAVVSTPNLPQTFAHDLAQPSLALYLVLLALIPGLAGLLIYYSGLRHTPATYATLAELAYPAATVIITTFVLKAPPVGMQIVGVVLVAGSITAMNLIKGGVHVAAAPEPTVTVAR
ncbi:MAG: DMT family transporter, partial [Ktedonobacterales bacterium]|nr:DMT family transporter [Ktedonobacterales bacterium]